MSSPRAWYSGENAVESPRFSLRAPVPEGAGFFGDNQRWRGV